jgi:succinoglycan biosynthesis transport protein ExoP
MKSLPRMIRATRPAGYSGEPPGPPMPASTIEDAPLSANQLMRAVETVRRRWVAVLMLMACVVIPGVYRIGHQVPVYRATAIIRLRDVQGELTGGLAGGPISELTRSIDPVRSQIEVLTSRDVASQVVDSTPELRLDASGFSSGLLDSLRIDSLVQSDSVMLEFLPSRVVVRSEHGQASGPYGVPLDAGVIRFSLRRHSAGRGVLQIRSRESAVDHVMGSIEVKQRDGTDVIDVTYFDTDPARGQRVVNRVVRVYQLSSAAAAQQRSIRRRAFLEGQLRYHDSILSAARVELSQFRGRQRAYSTKLRISSEQASLTELQVQRESMSADRRMYQDLLEQLQSNSNAPDDSQIGAIMSSPGMAANPVIGELFAQLTRYQSARDSLTTGRFGRPSNNPEVQQIDAMIASTKQKLAGGVRSYITALDAKIGSLDQLQAQSASSFPELSATEGREGVLEEQVEAARTTVGQLRSEYEKARLAEAVEVGQVEIVSLAALPRSPIGIGPLRKTVFLVLLGLGFGIGLVYLLERLNTSVRRRGQVRELLNVAELAVIPQIPLRKQLRRQRNGSTARGGSAVTGHRRPLGDVRLVEGRLVAASDVHSIAAEAYRLLRTNLLFSLPEGPLRTVLVTSPAPGDGKTTVAANLAIAFAQQGMRVLLIDGDLRRGRLHALFHRPREPGLTQVLAGRLTLDAAVHATPVNGLFVLATGGLPEGPNELLGADPIQTLLRQAAAEFAMIVIDSPPVLAAPDAAVLSTFSDATILVIRAGRTQEQEAQICVDQLAAVGANVVGAVLNDPDSAIRANMGEYAYYDKYYGREVRSPE